MLNRERLQRAQARMRQQQIDAYLILTHDHTMITSISSGRTAISRVRLFSHRDLLS